MNVHRVECKDGSYKWILDKGKVVERDSNNNPIRFLGTHVDITKHVENERKLANTLNIVTKQNNQLKNFAHIVTHNLKQHAANFESLLDFYNEAESEFEKEDTLKYLQILSESLSKTIANLKEIVSVQNNRTAKIEKIYLAQETDRILKMLKVVIKDNHAEVLNNIDPKLFIHYNQSYIESIIQNLLTNAIKYKHPDRHPKITVDSMFDSETIKIAIGDNGIGIDLDKYGNFIFGLYKTFHKNQDAEGIGLYLIKNQIEAYGGNIEVDSKVNVGTTFTISIPNKKTAVVEITNV